MGESYVLFRCFAPGFLLIGLILVTCAGCFGPMTDVSNVDLIVEQNTSDPNMTGAPDGFPRVETTDSHIIVTDQIEGITDPSCREITANATTREGSPALVLTIQTNVSVMKDSCGTTTHCRIERMSLLPANSQNLSVSDIFTRVS